MSANDRPCQVNMLLLDHALPDSTTSNIRVVGFEITYCTDTGGCEAKDMYHLNDLLAHLRVFPTLRAVSICFAERYEMLTAMESQGSCLQDRPLGDVKICLSLRPGLTIDTDPDEIIGIDIKTLAPNGKHMIVHRSILHMLRL